MKIKVVEMKTLVKLLEIPLWFAALYLLGPLVTGFWVSVVVMFVVAFTIIWTGDTIINKLERITHKCAKKSQN